MRVGLSSDGSSETVAVAVVVVSEAVVVTVVVVADVVVVSV